MYNKFYFSNYALDKSFYIFQFATSRSINTHIDYAILCHTISDNTTNLDYSRLLLFSIIDSDNRP